MALALSTKSGHHDTMASSSLPIEPAQQQHLNPSHAKFSIADLMATNNDPRGAARTSNTTTADQSSDARSPPSRSSSRAAATASKPPIAPAEDGVDSTSPTTNLKQPRKSRVLRRKTDHSVIERRRREKINERLIRLQEMVPACRDEVMEMLDKKPLKRNGAGGSGKANLLTDEGERKAEIERKCSEEMVLEKLCIISHTVDYVMELRSQVAAYRRLCQCDPPVGDPAPRDPMMHLRFAHELLAAQGGDASEEITPPISAAADRSQSPTATTSTSNTANSSHSPEFEAASSSASMTAGSASAAAAPKRKRHWGSNRPPRAAPAAKKKQRIVGTATPATNKTTRAAARAIAAGSNGVPATRTYTDDEDDEESGEASDEEADYDDEAFQMDDEHGCTAGCPLAAAAPATTASAAASSKRRFSDPLHNVQQQHQQLHQHSQKRQLAQPQRSALPSSYMRGEPTSTPAPAGGGQRHSALYAAASQQHHQGCVLSQMNAPTTKIPAGDRGDQECNHSACQYGASEGEGTRCLELLASVSAVSQ